MNVHLLCKTLFYSIIFFFLISCKEKEVDNSSQMYIGWASENTTPNVPVIIHGQFHARVSEGIMDPVTATALAIESIDGQSSKKVILISCDLVFITDELRDAVRKRVTESLPEIKPEEIILNATHTHSGPQYSASREVIKETTDNITQTSNIKSTYGIELEAMEFSDCLDFLTINISKTAKRAWKNRKPGGISYGLGHAAVGNNRLQSGVSGKSQMYGNTNRKDFSHIEGYEDHSVNLLFTWDNKKNITGVVVNLACPSQVSEGDYLISADFWHETRIEIKKRIGEELFILPQCSAAGDQSPHLMIEKKAKERMQQLMFPGTESGRNSSGRRKQIAMHIADAVTSVLHYTKNNIEWNPIFEHKVETIEISRRLIEIEDVNNAMKEAKEWEKKFEKMLFDITENPEMKEKPRWYLEITRTHRLMLRSLGVKERYEKQKMQPRLPIEIHVLRIGNIAMATNPFEYYVDYGMQIKARSPAIQTFLVQLAGSGSYVPTNRSISGGAYGAVPTSTLVGPEGGYELAEETLKLIDEVWEK
ncbi:hypothetical protein D1164_13880 [Mariniphaga sediminis]|uniref:Neutral/alkaline non-lysosomal ceramidase N-terminal domain-containing protein n=1 Tax=Mariniphaga sediminis TaxID=1628158 RepID=A0A399D208_9BACT|nr:hypothetical protein [Mariniphaga sediminis]RIH64722.1 hypothetical protein D1164_13880 [Mariniphaga sediminis]